MKKNEKNVKNLKSNFKNSFYLLVGEAVFFLFSLWVYSSAEKKCTEMLDGIVEPVSLNYAKVLNEVNNVANNSTLLCLLLAIAIFLTIFVFLYNALNYLCAK